MLHLYKASAGSGKTFALTRHYLTLLLGDRNPISGKWRLRNPSECAHSNILAITFTNKATQEMTRRIITELATLSGREPSKSGKKSPYLSYFLELFEVEEQALAETASKMLDELLADFSHFNVSTIDAFFQSVLRIFAREVDLPDNYQVELSDRSAVEIGVGQMFDTLNQRLSADPLVSAERKWVTAWLNTYMQRSLDEGKSVNLLSRSSNVFNALVDSFVALLNEDFKINSAEILDYLSDLSRLAAFEKGIASQTHIVEASLTKRAIAIMQYGDYDQISGHVSKYIESWAAGAKKVIGKTKTIPQAAVTIEKRFKKAYLKTDYSQELDAELTLFCTELVQYDLMLLRNTILTEAITYFGLIGCLQRHIQESCKEDNLMLLSETTGILSRIIDGDDTPFVYERLGYYLHHFLVDEFQDTSRMQWNNLRPLLVESMANGYDNLIIGDEKQCIYRFRNSDPELLANKVSDEIGDVFTPSAILTQGNTINSNSNWRSSSEVVKFNNSIFTSLASLLDCSETFGNVVQQIDPSREQFPGHIMLFFQPEEDKAENVEEASNEEDNQGDIDEQEEATSQQRSFAVTTTIDQINRLLSQGYRQRDIAILVYRHSQAKEIVDGLLAVTKEYPDWSHGPLCVNSEDSLEIQSSLAVKMILEVLKLTVAPRSMGGKPGASYDLANLSYVFRYSMRYNENTSDALTDAIATVARAERIDNPIEKIESAIANRLEEIFTFARAASSSADAAIEDAGEMAGVGEDADALQEKQRIACLTLNQIVDKIIALFVTPEMLESEAPYLMAFQDAVADFCAKGESDIASFLQWWELRAGAATIDGAPDTDGIMIMTIHKAKGLEFPCVIIPYANSTPVVFHGNKPSYEWMKIDADYFPGIDSSLVPSVLPLPFKSQIASIPMFNAEAEEIIHKRTIDALNVLYVAFTRAVDELIVIAPAKKKDTTSFDKRLRQAVESCTAQYIANMENDGVKPWLIPLAESFKDDLLEIGSPHPPRKRKAEAVLPDVALPSYNPNVNAKMSTLTEADITRFDFNNPRDRGTFLHNVLSKVGNRDSFEVALRRAAYRAHLSDEDCNYCHDSLKYALDNPEVARWFDEFEYLLVERSIVSDGVRRPDRVVCYADGSADVIDFKFGEHHGSYERQVKRYAKLLHDAGYSPVRAFLWYPLEKDYESAVKNF